MTAPDRDPVVAAFEAILGWTSSPEIGGLVEDALPLARARADAAAGTGALQTLAAVPMFRGVRFWLHPNIVNCEVQWERLREGDWGWRGTFGSGATFAEAALSALHNARASEHSYPDVVAALTTGPGTSEGAGQ